MGRLSPAPPPPSGLPTLRTARLTLRPAGPGDVEAFAGLNADPEVMRYLARRPATRAETEAEWTERLGARTDGGRGLGYWVGERHDVGPATFAGWWAASSYAPDPTVAMIGYRLPRSAWGRGLATEGALAVVEHAWTGTDVGLCRAATMAVNHGSRRVLEKLGMTHVATEFQEWFEPVEGSEHGEVVYELHRPGR